MKFQTQMSVEELSTAGEAVDRRITRRGQYENPADESAGGKTATCCLGSILKSIGSGVSSMDGMTDEILPPSTCPEEAAVPGLTVAESDAESENKKSRRIAGFIRTQTAHISDHLEEAEEIDSAGENSSSPVKESPTQNCPASLLDFVSRLRPQISSRQIEQAVANLLDGLAPSERKVMTSYRAPVHVDVFYKVLPNRLLIQCPELKRVAAQDIVGVILETVMTDEETRRTVLLPVIKYLLEKNGATITNVISQESNAD